MTLGFVKNRTGEIVEFDAKRIQIAIEKAYLATKTPAEKVPALVKVILEDLEHKHIHLADQDFLDVEMIQDVVEKHLMEAGEYHIAKAYIVYRTKQTEARVKEHEEIIEKIQHHTLMVTKTDNSQQPFDREKIYRVYQRIAGEYLESCPFDLLEEQINMYIIDGIKSSEILSLLIKSAINLISVENINWQYIAGRFMMLDLYKQASNNRKINISEIYSGVHYKTLFDTYIKEGLYHKDFYDYYSEDDILVAGNYIKKERDLDYSYTTNLMFKKRYLLNPNKNIRELPQEMYMSVALFLAMPEPKEKRMAVALKIYDHCSSQKISLPTPTLMNARTNFCQLSSCFKLNVDDDLRCIYHGIENMAQISKFGGGIGTYLGNIRSKGSYIRGVKGASGGTLPWIKAINDTAIAVNQLGARAGAISVTTDIRHRDIFDFLEMQTERGDIRRKAYDIFPAVSIPDLFMKRVLANESRTLFDPKEIEDIHGKKLQDHFTKDFDAFYLELENDSRITLKESIAAKELFKEILKSTVETGMPYIFFRDTVNEVNPNKHAGNVYSTQLCTEICQNTSPSKFVEEKMEGDVATISYKAGDSVVCNLASINMAKVYTQEEIDSVIPIAMRILDNVITLNFYPIKEAELTAQKYRSVGLGFLGLAEHLATNKMMYESPEARKYVDELFEKYAYQTLQSSHGLAVERGQYQLFAGSDRSKGILFGRDEKRYKNNSTLGDKWSSLIANIKQDGLRFAYHLSPAPNTSTSLVVGTTAGLLPIYKKYFVDNNGVAATVNVAPNLTLENTRYYKEYAHMDMNKVIDMIGTIQKWIDQSISFEWMIDPSVVTPRELYSYYIKAWEEKIKTIYYVRSMSLEVKECSSCSG